MEPFPQNQQLAVTAPNRTAIPAPAVRWHPGDQLIGDLERGALCDQLSTAFATGRLTDDELDQRLALAFNARTRREAQLLIRDLEPSARPVATPPEPKPTWTPSDLLLILVLTGCVLAVIVMLLASAAISPTWFFCAVVGGTFAVTAGASATHLLHRRRPLRQQPGRHPG